MNWFVIVGAVTALAVGTAVGVQSTIGARLSLSITPLMVGLFTTIIGGTASLIILLFLDGGSLDRFRGWPSGVWPLLLFNGLIGIAIIVGIAFSFSRAGVAAGVVLLVCGQMLVGAIADHFGLGGSGRIPFDWQRLAGFALMVPAIWLLLPKS